MATFELTGPDGRKMELTTPDGATPEMIKAKIADIKANWGTIKTEPQTSATGAFLTGLGQSVFGLGDEIEAGARAAYDAATTDKGLGEAYDQNLGDVRARVDASAKQHPVAYYGGEIGGMVAMPMGVAAGAARVPGMARALTALGQRAGITGQGLAARMGAGAAEGATYGGLYGFGKSEGGVQNRLEGTGGGALVGGTLGGAAPAVLAGLSAAAQPVRNTINSVVNPEREAARRIVEAQASGREAQQAANRAMGGPQNAARDQEVIGLLQSGRAGDELRNIDQLAGGGEPVRALARSAANNSPEAREVLNRMTNDRFEGQSGRFAEFVRGLIPRNELVSDAGNASLTREAVDQMARNANRPAYRAAYQAGDRTIWTPELEQISNAPVVRQAMQRAMTTGKDRAAVEGYGQFNPGVRFNPDTMEITFQRSPNGVVGPNLQYWDQVKRELDDIAGEAGRTGAGGQAGNAAALARQLREHLDTVVPEYATARGTAANYFHADNALDAGRVFANGNHDNAEVARIVGRMGQQEQRLFREGFVSDFLQKIEQSPDRRTIVSRFANSPSERQKMEIALGPQRARELEAFLHIENVMDFPRGAMGNSTTARQLVELGLAGGVGTLLGGGNPLDPKALTIAALTYGARRGQGALNERMARRIAEMLVSRDPQVMQRALRIVGQHPNAVNSLRSFSQAISRLSASGAGSAMAQQNQPLTGTITRRDIEAQGAGQ
ncbi:MAG: hypothetical protein AB7U76_26055 [Pirellulales bacterium]